MGIAKGHSTRAYIPAFITESDIFKELLGCIGISIGHGYGSSTGESTDPALGYGKGR